MERMIIAYVLVALLVLLVAGTAWYQFYHSRERIYRRRLKRENDAYRDRMAAKAAERLSPAEARVPPL